MVERLSQREVGRIPKAPDLEVVFTRIQVNEDGRHTFLDIRDRVISTGQLGRGILIPIEQIEAVAKIMDRLRD